MFDTQEQSQRNWIWIGFQFGLGFGLAGAIFAGLGTLAAYSLARYEITVTNELFSGLMHSATYAPAPKAGHYETRHVAGQDVDQCRQQTGSTITPDFMRCRNGYDQQVWIPSP